MRAREKFAIWWGNTKANAKEFFRKARTYVEDHKEEVKAIFKAIVVAIPVFIKAGKAIGKARDKRFAEMHYYDASMMKYIPFRRKPKAKELEAARAIHEETGRTYYSIYHEMGLLK